MGHEAAQTNFLQRSVRSHSNEREGIFGSFPLTTQRKTPFTEPLRRRYDDKHVKGQSLMTSLPFDHAKFEKKRRHMTCRLQPQNLTETEYDWMKLSAFTDPDLIVCLSKCIHFPPDLTESGCGCLFFKTVYLWNNRHDVSHAYHIYPMHKKGQRWESRTIASIPAFFQVVAWRKLHCH